MEIRGNIAKALRAYKDLSGKTYAECAKELAISPTDIKDYISGRGNPSISTIEHIAEKLGIDVSFLVSGTFSQSQTEVLYSVLNVIGLLEKVPASNRVRVAELLLEIIDLLSEADDYDTQMQTAQADKSS